MNKRVQEARKFAIERHGSQMYGEKPYIYHLDMVYEIVNSLNLGEDYEVAAFLHDAMEDTNTTKEEIALRFGLNVAELVFSVTGEGNSRKERKESTIRKLNAFHDGINLKMADRLANMQSSVDIPKLFDMYKNELSDYLELFQKGDQELLRQIQQLVTPKKMKPN